MTFARNSDEFGILNLPAGAHDRAGDAAALDPAVAADDAVPQPEVPPRIAHRRQWPEMGRPLLGHLPPRFIALVYLSLYIVLPSAMPDTDRLFRVLSLVPKKLRCQILDCYALRRR